MIFVDALLVLAMLFFLFLPITDRKTARMKVCVLGALLVAFVMSAAWNPDPGMQLAALMR